MSACLAWFALTSLTLCARATLAADGYQWLADECPPAYNVTGVARLPEEARPEVRAKVVLNYHGPEQHLAVTLTRRELVGVKVEGGKATPLWRGRALPDRAEHRFVIKRRANRLAVVVDGTLVGQADFGGSPGGKVGSLATGGAACEKLLCQEVEPVYFTDDFVRGDGELGIWEPVGGEWRVESIGGAEVDAGRSANPFSCSVKADGRSLAVTGYGFWDSYLLRVSVRPQAPGAVGLVVFYQDPRNYVLFRWHSRGGNASDATRQFVCVRDGTEQVHNAAGAGYVPGQWYQLTVKATDARLEAFLDDAPVGVLEGPPFCGGKIGLYAEGCASATFDDVFCRHWGRPADDPSPFLDTARLPVQFSLEDTMSGWASPESDWLPGEGGWRWHKGTFWGDASLACELQQTTDPSAYVDLAIHADEGALGSGYTLAVTPSADASTLACVLYRQGKKVGQCQVAAGDWPVTVELRRHQKALLVEVGGEQVLTAVDQHPLPGKRTGVRAAGMAAPAEGLFATGTNFLDDMFLTAPTRWWQGRGDWRVTSRWSCQPGWTWLTGTGESTPVLWSKRAFGGDFTVEAFVANRMDLVQSYGYSHPGDLNLTVCGDGRSLTSGYSFVFAGWGNTCSALFRQAQCVGRNQQTLRSAAAPPGSVTGAYPQTGAGPRILPDPVNTNSNFHRHWFRVRVERRGRRLEQWVDDMRVHTYDDPAPLPAGRLALWTCGVDPAKGGLVVARIRIWYERAVEAGDFPAGDFHTDTAGPWLEPVAPGPTALAPINTQR
jgi:hypothetical protein